MGTSHSSATRRSSLTRIILIVMVSVMVLLGARFVLRTSSDRAHAEQEAFAQYTAALQAEAPLRSGPTHSPFGIAAGTQPSEVKDKLAQLRFVLTQPLSGSPEGLSWMAFQRGFGSNEHDPSLPLIVEIVWIGFDDSKAVRIRRTVHARRAEIQAAEDFDLR